MMVSKGFFTFSCGTLPSSVIGQLNQTGSLTNVSDETRELLLRVHYWFRITNGVINALTANQQVANGYGQLAGRHSETQANPLTNLVVTDTSVTLETGALDLGGFAKGWLIDRIVTELEQEFGLQYLLINGGGDMYATSLPDGTPIDIAVEHPTQPNSYIAKVPLLHSGFAASSTYKRQWQTDAGAKQHILNPNEQPVLPGANQVVADTAEAADVYATLGCITPTQLQTVPHIEYCYLPESGTACILKAFQSWLWT